MSRRECNWLSELTVARLNSARVLGIELRGTSPFEFDGDIMWRLGGIETATRVSTR